ncbi:hypothetical protein XELAEV_18002980mg [Xenopus laevis]|uniref:Uncharacterized protein n=1 Tax=Xenopus laevis TaxID=8355 RepID=A0A974BND4_XENLA|nr:hypothetical protein XELAEV_18002980mg [Xenopus laevis]
MRDIQPFVFEYISSLIYCWQGWSQTLALYYKHLGSFGALPYHTVYQIQDPPILCHHVRSDDVIRAGVVPHWDLKSHVSGNLNGYFINSVGPHPPLLVIKSDHHTLRAIGV